MSLQITFSVTIRKDWQHLGHGPHCSRPAAGVMQIGNRNRQTITNGSDALASNVSRCSKDRQGIKFTLADLTQMNRAAQETLLGQAASMAGAKEQFRERAAISGIHAKCYSLQERFPQGKGLCTRSASGRRAFRLAAAFSSIRSCSADMLMLLRGPIPRKPMSNG